jgi:hypothetical protein
VEAQAEKLQKEKRLLLMGYGIFRYDHEKAHALMTGMKVAHEYRDGPARKHDWHSGWVVEAVEMLWRGRSAVSNGPGPVSERHVLVCRHAGLWIVG